MKIIFIGSSHGFPEPNRKCSAILIEAGKSRYFIDMGAQANEALADRGIRPEEIRACFVTHMHGDHTNGLISFIDLCSWFYKDANPKFYLPGDTCRAANAIGEWISCLGYDMRSFEFGHVDDGFEYCDEDIKLVAYRNGHMAQSFSYVLEAEGKRVFFSGDLGTPQSLGNPLADIPLGEFDKGFDLAVLELAHFDATEKYYPLLKDRTNIKTVCINHYSNYFLGSAFDLIKKLPDQEVVFATDGLEINLNN